MPDRRDFLFPNPPIFIPWCEFFYVIRGTSRHLLTAAITCRSAECEYLKHSTIDQCEAVLVIRITLVCPFLCGASFLGEDPLAKGENGQTLPEDPLCRRHAEVGYQRFGTGDTPLVHIMSLSGFEPMDLPAGEMFGRFQQRYPLRHPAPLI